MMEHYCVHYNHELQFSELSTSECVTLINAGVSV